MKDNNPDNGTKTLYCCFINVFFIPIGGNRMEMEKGKLNCFFVDTQLKWGRYNPDVIFINATEEEFNRLLDNYIAENISEIESKGGNFNINFFRNYVLKSGYYAYTQPNKVLPPYAPLK
jgi:hypothetical protein